MTTAMPDPEISVVIPTYGCRDCMRALHERLTAALAGVTPRYEIVFVDDRSPDGAWEIILELAQEDQQHVRALRLSRNFGQQAAITAGLAASRGNWTIVMDCDLQEPPELIPELYAKAQEGYDVVFARRRRRNVSRVRTAAANMYFRFQRVFLGNDLTGDYASYSILSRRVREAFLRIRDQDRHYLPIVRWLGFEQASVDFDHAPRFAGKSSYTFRRLVQLAIEGVFFQTTALLIWIVWLGFALAVSGILLALYFLYSYATANPYPGWTSLAVLLLVIGGFIIISTGVTGLYIGTIFKQVKDRPLYLIDEEISSAEMRSSPADGRAAPLADDLSRLP